MSIVFGSAEANEIRRRMDNALGREATEHVQRAIQRLEEAAMYAEDGSCWLILRDTIHTLQQLVDGEEAIHE